ncbi:DUF2268 domain-containing protein [Paenibacillus sp. GCM10027627]|uniref:DUF2268 domain-containing protein n=1 Tax=unclassified Paenibacillus TaxID=185978 RepID=UPI00362E9BB0
MEIISLRSDHIYKKVLQAPQTERVEFYRQEMLAPFIKKWEIQHIPFKSAEPGGFDAMTLNDMMGISPAQLHLFSAEIEALSSDSFWQECEEAVAKSFRLFEEHGVNPPVSRYLFTILLGNPNNPILMMNEGYTGDGGIPGYIICSMVPNEYTMPRMKAALAHECNHNVRYQFIEWDFSAVTLGELIVSEGLAEYYATSLFGEELLGPWVSKTSEDTLNKQIKPVLKQKLQLAGFGNITPYLYGDELTQLQNGAPVGMPYCAGYACGYYLIKYYLEKTGKTIYEATIIPADLILKEAEGFWEEETVTCG